MSTHNVERTGRRSLAMSKLWRKTPSPARGIDIDYMRCNTNCTKIFYLMEAHDLRAKSKPYEWTVNLSKMMTSPVPVFQCVYEETANEEVKRLQLTQVYPGAKIQHDWMTPEQFTQWDSQWR